MTPLPAAAPIIRYGRLLTVLGLLGMAVVYLLALRYTPVEARQGMAQKIFYVHAPAAWGALIAFVLVGVASILYLWLHDPRLDLFAEASAEVGLAFSAVMLTTGPIWGKPIWGTWWAWDARLTSTLILFIIYSGYLLARSLADASDLQAARFGAVFAIIGFVDIPIINMSVRWWRTLHPQPIVQRGLEPDLPGGMLIVLLIGFVAVLLLAAWLIALRAETERIAVRSRELRIALDRREGA